MNKSPRFLPLLAIAFLAGIVLASGSFVAVKIAGSRPDPVFTREGILKILGRESVVYFADGKTPVGTFFADAHRDYVPFDSIPKTIVDALVSAEDRNYWTHGGVDYRGFASAMWDNLKSMSLKRGGSTLTQQTAKNLFGRRGRTVRGKIDELINAYKLEKHFSKQEILEFYLNQFFVTGNGHGVRIAARYFFDKDLKNLDLAECAFIAGSVKGPNQYNPFLQDTKTKRDAVLQRANYRVAYVLKQMRRQEKISETDYQKALAEKLPFRRGLFRYSLSTNMVTVKHLLDNPEMQKVLTEHGVEDYTTAGLQVFTTLDPEVQRATEYAVYSNLWRLDLLLRGYHSPADTDAELLSHFIPGEFHTGRVIALELRQGIPVNLRVSFGALEGTVPQAALEAFFKQWNRRQSGSDAVPSKHAMATFAAQYLKKGQSVFCAIPYRTPQELAVRNNLGSELELTQKPSIQGAAQVIQAGRVLANVGGFGNTGYDRVNQARRQFGSAFKPLVYAAALELGWKPLDALHNFRQIFHIGNVFYNPKPDHPPEDTVSMAWAGRRSENIGSVYLLFHLFDKTDFSHFWEACRSMRLAPDNFPSQADFETYVRDTLGLILDDEHLRELRYRKAVEDLSIDLIFEGLVQEAEHLRDLPYGAGFHAERAKHQNSHDPEDQLASRLLQNSYLDLLERSSTSSDSLMMGGVSRETLLKIDATLKNRIGADTGSRYSTENLYASTDFRALAALHYMVAFSHKIGITSKLDPVASFPLGVNAISLGEAVNSYQAFQDGGAYHTHLGQSQLYIEKISMPDGQVIFTDTAMRDSVLSNRTRYSLEAILGAVVRGGTGQRIGRELRMPSGRDSVGIVVPAFGKTGTTNDYRNAAFFGYVAAPREEGKGFDPATGYVIGVYSGFDDNVGMTRPGFRGTGASAAVPAWLNIAQTLVKLKNFSMPDSMISETGEAPLFEREKYKRYAVSRRTGLPIVAGDSAAPAYADDLADELDASGAAGTTGATSLWIREE